MDVKRETDFENYYQNEYKNIISNYYELLNESKIKLILKKCVLASVISIIYIILLNEFNLKSVFNNYYMFIIIISFAVIIISTILSILKGLNYEIQKINQFIIKDLLAFISGNDFDRVIYEPHKKVSEESFDKMELFNLNVVKYNGRNYIKVPYDGNNMVFSDMHIYDTYEEKKQIYKNGKSYIKTIQKKRTILNGMYIGATLDKKINSQIYLIPNNIKDTILQGKMMGYIKYSRVPVVLENLEFSKKYKVFCDDEVQARYILSLSLMEKINKIDNIFKEKKYIVFKEGNRFAICIEGVTIDNIKNTKIPVFRNEIKELRILINMFTKLNNLFKIYHILDLDNDLYKKH